MRLQATLHYLLHNVYRYVYIRECMTITSIRRSKSVVQECMVSFTFQTLNLSTGGKFRAIPICFTAVSPHICMGRFKFMVNFSLIKYQ